MDTIYIEHQVADHDKTQAICSRYPDARRVPIVKYKDVFNAPAQNFRQQKQSPKLILAHQSGNRLHPTPPGYHIGGENNYYFSHMLNCVYDCRYCFLQGMYQSANYVFFVNTEDFLQDITNTSNESEEISWFFSGYDCDSLALNPITGFVDSCLDHFTTLNNAYLELRTKSTQIRCLLSREPVSNVVVAYSLSPESIAKHEEHGAPSLKKRLDALASLQNAGWLIGLRFDPLLYASNFDELYEEFFYQVFNALDASSIHSVSLGVFRLPRDFYKRLVKLYPDAKLLAAPLHQRDGMVSYPEADESRMREFCMQQLSKFIRDDQLFPCS